VADQAKNSNVEVSQEWGLVEPDLPIQGLAGKNLLGYSERKGFFCPEHSGLEQA
jgi:hypothetical protein